MNESGKFIGGLLVGTAVGLATGLLIAPSSGNQTRRNLVKKSRVYSQQAIDAVRQYLDSIKNGKHRSDLAGTDDILNELQARPNTGYEGI